jgi:capsular polysaccharide biosynthesis protein
MIIKSFYDLDKFNLIKDYDKNNRDIRLYKFKEVIITGISNFYPNILLKQLSDNYLILPTKEMTMSLNKRSYYEESNMNFDYKDIDLSKIKQLNPKDSIILGNKNIILEPVYFFIYNTENYFHFIYDTLPYLYSFLQLRKTNPKIKLLMNFINKNKNDFIPFVIEALELLDITRDDIIIHDTNNIYNQLYLSSSLTHNGLSNSPPRKEIFEIYDLMIKNARLKYEIGIKNLNLKKLYISRRTWTNKSNLKNIGTNYTNRRKLMNEDDLVELLKKENFNEIFGENFSFLEKVILFNNAEEVIGSIGGTIVNCVFCNKNCRVTCLVSPDFLRVNKRIKFSLINKNVKYFEDTYLDTENNKIPSNVRIEIINGKYKGFLGEIVKYENENKYLINLGDGRNIGWSNNEKYNKIILSDDNFKQLDFGLNSPWYIYLKKFLDFKAAMI